MAKRRRPRPMTAALMPRLKHAIAVSYRGHSDPEMLEMWSQLSHGETWWVTRPMAQLTYAAFEDFPNEDLLLENYVPSQSGVIYFDGGTGLSIRSRLPNNVPPRFIDEQVYGVYWARMETTVMLPLTLRPHEPSDIPGYLDTRVGFLVPAGPEHFDSPVEEVLQRDRLVRYLCTAFTLAEQESVARAYPLRTRSNTPSTPTPETGINVITLREAVHRPTGTTDKSDGGEGKPLEHRVLVRGHWKEQACGQGWTERKKLYISPYLKGPEEAPIKTKPAVKVWRR